MWGRRVGIIGALVLVMLATTIVAVAQQVGPPTSYAFVARGDNPVDALAAAPVAARLDAPIVLTRPNVLVDAAREALRDADPDIVVLAGGLPALSGSVESAVTSALPNASVRRVSGTNRYTTAQALAELFEEYQPAFAYRGTPVPPDTRGEAEVGQWNFNDVQIFESEFGEDFEARARVTNTGEVVEGVVWTLTLFAEGAIVGTASASANDIAAGDTITVEFTSSDDFVAWDAYDIQVDTQF